MKCYTDIGYKDINGIENYEQLKTKSMFFEKKELEAIAVSLKLTIKNRTNYYEMEEFFISIYKSLEKIYKMLNVKL